MYFLSSSNFIVRDSIVTTYISSFSLTAKQRYLRLHVRADTHHGAEERYAQANETH